MRGFIVSAQSSLDDLAPMLLADRSRPVNWVILPCLTEALQFPRSVQTV